MKLYERLAVYVCIISMSCLPKFVGHIGDIFRRYVLGSDNIVDMIMWFVCYFFRNNVTIILQKQIDFPVDVTFGEHILWLNHFVMTLYARFAVYVCICIRSCLSNDV